jgi:hypothetical protein
VGSGASGSGADGPGTSGSGGSLGYGDPGANPDCVAQSVGADESPPVLMLLVDTSQSMSETRFASTNGRSKWEAARDALSQALNALPPSYAMGLVFYPNTPNSRPPPCFEENLIDIAPLSGAHIAEMEAAMANHDVAGYTPTQVAWQYAYEQLVAWQPTDPIYQNSARYMIVITDGVPTRGQDCEMPLGRLALARSQYQPLIDAVASGNSNGVGTFVIGAPGSEDDTQGNQEYNDPAENYIAREMLSTMAVAGGMAPVDCSNDGNPQYCHIDLTTATDFTAELTEALVSIGEQVISCTYNIPDPPTQILNDDPDTFVVEYYPGNGAATQVLLRADASCANGWRLTEDQQAIELCPATCDAVSADPGAAIQVLFECVDPM